MAPVPPMAGRNGWIACCPTLTGRNSHLRAVVRPGPSGSAKTFPSPRQDGRPFPHLLEIACFTPSPRWCSASLVEARAPVRPHHLPSPLPSDQFSTFRDMALLTSPTSSLSRHRLGPPWAANTSFGRDPLRYALNLLFLGTRPHLIVAHRRPFGRETRGDPAPRRRPASPDLPPPLPLPPPGCPLHLHRLAPLASLHALRDPPKETSPPFASSSTSLEAAPPCISALPDLLDSRSVPPPLPHPRRRPAFALHLGFAALSDRAISATRA